MPYAGNAISALAPNVKLAEKALVSASGASGGGAIALLGVNREPAKSIDVAKGATLDASATTSGPGGTVSVSADGIEFREWPAWVGFTNAPLPHATLGFAGCMQFFTTTFHGDREEVELAVNGLYPGT